MDIYPTLCALGGIPAPANLAGRSLDPVLTDPKASVQDAVFQVYPRSSEGRKLLGRAVRTASHRYVEWRAWGDTGVMECELYDYENDPEETVNLAADAAYRAVVNDLAARIAALGPARPQVRS